MPIVIMTVGFFLEVDEDRVDKVGAGVFDVDELAMDDDAMVAGRGLVDKRRCD